MSDRAMTEEMPETFRADFWQWSRQPAKLEKIQKLRQAIQRLHLPERQSKPEAPEPDLGSPP